MTLEYSPMLARLCCLTNVPDTSARADLSRSGPSHAPGSELAASSQRELRTGLIRSVVPCARVGGLPRRRARPEWQAPAP